MWLSITTTHRPATDLGYLLVKHPQKFQTYSLPYGRAHVFYPEADYHRCTAVLMLELDAVHITREDVSGNVPVGPFWAFVNDRPYVASSFFCLAMGRVFSSALKGQCVERAELAGQAIPLQAEIALVASREGSSLIRWLFEPLGYQVDVDSVELDPQIPSFGPSVYGRLRLQARCRLSDLLRHIYAGLLVLDDQKFYWMGDREARKLVQRAQDWLGTHPHAEQIVARYLRPRVPEVTASVARLLSDEHPDYGADYVAAAEARSTQTDSSAWMAQVHRVISVLKELGARRVIELSCGDGLLIEALARDPFFVQVAAVSASRATLDRLRQRLRMDRLPPQKARHICLIHGTVLYRDNRLRGYDAAYVGDIGDHGRRGTLSTFENAVWRVIRPPAVIVLAPKLTGRLQLQSTGTGQNASHGDDCLWMPATFQEWARRVAERFGYSVRFVPLDAETTVANPEAQAALFVR